MSYCDNSYNYMSTDKEVPYTSYGTGPYYRAPQATPEITPAMPLPTGVPSGPPYGGVPLTTIATAAPSVAQPPQSVQSPYFLAGKLRSYVGKDVRVEFLIGTNGPLVDRIGRLLEVGASYIIIRPIRSNDTLICDLFSIKFVTVYA